MIFMLFDSESRDMTYFKLKNKRLIDDYIFYFGKACRTKKS